MFFPGVCSLKIQKFADDTSIKSENLSIDHYSLEQNLRAFHISFIDKSNIEKRLRILNTKKIEDGFFLWLVMGIKSEDKLEVTPKRTTFTINTNQREIPRRINEIIRSVNKTPFNVMQLSEKSIKNKMINFEFFIVTKKISQYPIIDPVHFVENNKENTDPLIPICWHRIFLKDFDGTILIRTSSDQVDLEHDALIKGGMDFYS